jgi:hypothetical protein
VSYFKICTNLTPLFVAKEQLIVCRTPYVSRSVILSDFNAALMLSSKISCKSPATVSAKQKQCIINYTIMLNFRDSVKFFWFDFPIFNKKHSRIKDY